MAKNKKAKVENDSVRSTNLWDRQSPLKRHAFMVLTIVILSFIFFAPLHFSGKKLVGGDTVGWRAQAESMLEYRAETGEEPLWATNVFGGMPGYYISYHNAVPQADAIARILRKVIWPSSHFIFLLLGTYVCGFLLTKNEIASLFGAVAYGFTTYIPVLLSAGHNTKFVTLAFAPWMIAAFIYTLRKPGLAGGLLFGVASAAVLRTGGRTIYLCRFAVHDGLRLSGLRGRSERMDAGRWRNCDRVGSLFALSRAAHFGVRNRLCPLDSGPSVPI